MSLVDDVLLQVVLCLVSLTGILSSLTVYLLFVLDFLLELFGFLPHEVKFSLQLRGILVLPLYVILKFLCYFFNELLVLRFLFGFFCLLPIFCVVNISLDFIVVSGFDSLSLLILQLHFLLSVSLLFLNLLHFPLELLLVHLVLFMQFFAAFVFLAYLFGVVVLDLRHFLCLLIHKLLFLL